MEKEHSSARTKGKIKKGLGMEIDNLHSAHITNCDLNTAKALNFILRMLELWKGYPRCFHSGPN